MNGCFLLTGTVVQQEMILKKNKKHIEKCKTSLSILVFVDSVSVIGICSLVEVLRCYQTLLNLTAQGSFNV